MIEVNGLTKYYGPRCAIENLSYQAKKGEKNGYLGPNGPGITKPIPNITGF